MDKPSNGFLDKVASDRRSFVQRLLGTAGFAVPAVRSFLMAAVATEIVPNIGAIPVSTTSATTPNFTTTNSTTTNSTTPNITTTSATTTSSPATTASPSTTPPVGTTAAPGGGSVPEIDATSASSALALLTGAVLIARDHRSSKKS